MNQQAVDDLVDDLLARLGADDRFHPFDKHADELLTVACTLVVALLASIQDNPGFRLFVVQRLIDHIATLPEAIHDRRDGHPPSSGTVH